MAAFATAIDAKTGIAPLKPTNRQPAPINRPPIAHSWVDGTSLKAKYKYASIRPAKMFTELKMITIVWKSMAIDTDRILVMSYEIVFKDQLQNNRLLKEIPIVGFR